MSNPINGKTAVTPTLDDRQIQAMVADLLARMPGYTPGWTPASTGPSWAIIQIYARYLRALAERVGLAPDKNKLAFLDLLGVNLLSAQAARAPIVFKPIAHIGDGRVPARTQVGADNPATGEKLIFETEASIALAAANLVEVVSLWPGKDGYAAHSTAVMGGQPFTLFSGLKNTPHEFYLAHDTHFTLSGKAIVELQCELAIPGSQPLAVVWEYWDGKVWRGFKAFVASAEADEDDSVDGTDGLTKSGVIRLAADCSETKPTTIQGRASSWLRGRLTEPLPPEPGLVLAQLDRLSIRTEINRTLPDVDVMPEDAGFPPDKAFANTLQLDVSKAIHPFGQQPQPGAAFYLTSAETFAKAGAEVTLYLTYVAPEQENPAPPPLTTPVVAWEYWNGRSWSPLAIESEPNVDIFKSTGSLTFTVPSDMTLTKVNNEEGFWIRARLKDGGYGIKRTLTFEGNTVVVIEIRPPVLGAVQMGYLYRSPQAQPTHCLTYNDFQWGDHTEDARWRGGSFEPFSLVADRTPTIYLGFDRPLPADQISLYLDVAEAAGQSSGPLLTWEYDDGGSWRSLSVADETNHLALPGMVTAVYPGVSPLPSGEAVTASGNQVQLANARQAARFRAGDLIAIGDADPPELMTVQSAADATLTLTAVLSQEYQRVPVTLAALPRFGKPRTWLRARLQSGGDPLLTQINGMHFNAVWAAQIQTIENEALGSSNGQANQVFFSRQSPVLAGEWLEVKELSGARAAVELAILQQELAEQGIGSDAITTVTDPRTGKISEVWVRWQEKPHLFFSQPDDRHYVIERSRGRLIFGDDQNGRIPSAGRDNIRLRQYRSGGGAAGNVAAEAITQLLSGVPAAGVSNPVAAEGGADTEPAANVHLRGPQVIRHHYQAISLSDYEALAREASPAVAVARALPTTHSSGRETPGWVKIIIMPHSQEAQPQPSFGLRRQVQAFLAARVPAAVAGQLTVTGPTYLPVGVQAVVTPLNAGEAGVVRTAVIAALEQFLHPLTGGPEGAGWAFGRDVYVSDVAAVLEAVRGVDYVSTLNLLLKGSPRGERVEIPPDRIVVAGQLKIMLA